MVDIQGEDGKGEMTGYCDKHPGKHELTLACTFHRPRPEVPAGPLCINCDSPKIVHPTKQCSSFEPGS